MSPVEQLASDSLDLPAAGQIFAGKYRIGASIGIGGMAAVFAAEHLDLDQKIALKFLLPELCHDAEIVERFLREGRAATKIRSEHVVRVHDVGVLDGRPYLVMEYLEGKDLDHLLAQHGALPVATAVDYLLQACEAIAEAHAVEIIHRDLKPANLFLTHRADGSASVKVLDFGISKMHAPTRAGSGVTPRATLVTTVMGSPHYMPPEQMESSAQVDARADIWSLGTILYELLANQQAFEGWSITEVCARVMRGHPAPLSTRRSDVPPALQAIIDRCLEKEPSARFGSVADLARALAPFGGTSAFASACTISRVLEGSHSFEGSIDGLAVTAVSLRPLPPTRLRARDILDGPPRRARRAFRGTVAMSVLALAAAG
ncbi:MAG TPA: serine/threonine-protein kinase, partial [Polyangiaceae bacterium]